MEFALDKNGNRIDAWNNHSSEGEFFCPVCGGSVIFRHGNTNVPHFAHRKSECTDDWHYDMSEWHKRMQSYYPTDNREIVVQHNGKTHRADVLIDKTVIEFQHSPISADEFNDRNSFFNALGFRIAWVFDVSDDYTSGRIISAEDGTGKYKWNWAPRVFSNAPLIRDNNKDFSLWLYFGSDDLGNGESDIDKVVWTPSEDGEQSLSWFICSRFISLDNAVCVDELFYSEMDYLNKAILDLKNKSQFSRKCIGKKGLEKEAYECPRSKKFGIDLFGESGCSYCRYCGIIARKERYGKSIFTVYCCYPNQVRELFECHPGYECSPIEMFRI